MRYTPTTQEGPVARARNHGKFARSQREHRVATYPTTQAPDVSADDMARQLADDPEFVAWYWSDLHGLVGR